MNDPQEPSVIGAEERHTEAEPSAQFFSLVFAGNLRAIRRNPHTTMTPYGLPVTVGFGNAFAEFDEFTERYSVLEAALESIARNTCCDTCREAALVARAALASAEGEAKAAQVVASDPGGTMSSSTKKG